MKAIVIDQFGGPEVLVEKDLPLPQPSRNQVRVKVKAVGFNPVDVKKRTGVYGDPLPSILGADFSGVIDAVGDPLGEFAVGDRVFGFTDGTYAESVCVSTQLIAKIPKNLSFEEAAVIPVVYVTAFQALVERVRFSKIGPFSSVVEAVEWALQRSIWQKPTEQVLCSRWQEARKAVII